MDRGPHFEFHLVHVNPNAAELVAEGGQHHVLLSKPRLFLDHPEIHLELYHSSLHPEQDHLPSGLQLPVLIAGLRLQAYPKVVQSLVMWWLRTENAAKAKRGLQNADVVVSQTGGGH